MYVIVEGQVEVRVGPDPEVMGPGELIGEMALIDGQPRSATVIARTPCRLARVDEKRFLFLVQQTPFFALQVMRLLAGRLRRRNQTARAAG
jgi:CRP-like cAMP-binding protein